MNATRSAAAAPAETGVLPSPGIPALRTWLVFVAIFAAFQALLDAGGSRLWGSFALWTARATAWSFALLGATASVEGTTVHSSLYDLNIIGECTALHPIMVYAAAVLAYPCRWRTKALGIGVGVAALLLLNQIRLVSLACIGRSWPAAFESAHKLVWPSLIIFFTVLLWIVWAAAQSRRHQPA